MSHLSEVEALEAVKQQGHRVESDQPAIMTAVLRWTCKGCGAALLRLGANSYGSALDYDCDVWSKPESRAASGHWLGPEYAARFILKEASVGPGEAST